MVKGAPLYAWQIEAQDAKNKQKEVFIKKYSEKIGLFKRFIYESEIIDLKEKYPAFVKVIEDIVQDSNKSFIRDMKQKIFIEFNSFLNNSKGIISREEIEKIHDKYKKGYCDFYKELRLEQLINKHNNVHKETEFRNTHFYSKKELSYNWEPYEPNIHEKSVGRNEIKEYLLKFNKQELYELLGLNPKLTVQKERSLRNQVVEEIINSDLDLDELIKLSKKEFIKEISSISLIKSAQNRKINQKKKILGKIKEFNSKSIEEIISSREDYYDVYKKVIYLGLNDNDALEFKYYYDNTDELKRAIEIKNYLNENSDEFYELYSIIQGGGYLTRKHANNLKDKYAELFVKINFEDFDEILIKKFIAEIDNLTEPVKFLIDLFDYNGLYDASETNLIKKHNEQILDLKINEDKEFFSDISDINKKRSVVLDEDNVRVFAGAGTGKTFTIQKKVKYLVEKQGEDPEKILCLCYTNKGASDLDFKVNKDLNDAKVEVCTFHEFCRRVDRYCGGNKSTNRYLLDSIIRNYIRNIFEDPEKISKITEYFSYYITPPLEREEFDTYEELIELEEAKELSTLKNKYYEAKYAIQSLHGEIVKSLGELIIANYLFMHEIDYEYERNYKHSFSKVLQRFLYSGKFLSITTIGEKPIEKIVNEFIDSELKWERYNPDFYLPEYDLYLEHFGIGHENNELWLHPNYENEMKEKFKCHEMHGTNLIATYYCYLEDGCLIEKLEELLKENNVVIGQKDKEEILNLLITTTRVNDYNDFKKLIKSFINIFEAHNLSKNKFDEFKKQTLSIKNGYNRKRQELFFDIISDIYDIYYEYNNGDTIDHNREISNALELIVSKDYDKSYDYVLIDEYQDINYIRCNLLQELQKNTGCKMFVVGDDWQSIYRFNGSDVNLFIDFKDYFPYAETIKLGENRRNPQKIIDISSDFILQNKNQEYKDLVYYKKVSNPHPIKFVSFDWWSYKGKDRILKLDAILKDIYKNNDPGKLEILLLGRKNNDISKFVGNALFKMKKEGKSIKILYSRYSDADITFMTIHQAKGLEYDDVIILNFENHIAGFPNKMEDDPILNYVKENEEYPYAEERRLLYVALTRTLNNVYLLVPDEKQSIFIDELRRGYDIDELYLSVDRHMGNFLWDDCDFFERMEYHKTHLDCPNCDGKITLMVDNKRGTKYFRCSNDLERNSSHFDGGPYTGTIEDLKYIDKCPECRGILVRKGDVLKCCLNYHKGCMQTKELKLDAEDMEYEE